jgi:hypothetical protein
MTIWFILKFALHKGGYIHMFLIGAIAVLVVQLIAYRKTQYHKTSAGR